MAQLRQPSGGVTRHNVQKVSNVTQQLQRDQAETMLVLRLEGSPHTQQGANRKRRSAYAGNPTPHERRPLDFFYFFPLLVHFEPLPNTAPSHESIGALCLHFS